MDKEHAVYIHNEILLSHKKDEILSFVTTWLDLEGIILSEISQMEKDKYRRISLYEESKKQNKTNGQTKENKNKLIDTEIRLVVTREEGSCWGWTKREKGLNCAGMGGNWTW